MCVSVCLSVFVAVGIKPGVSPCWLSALPPGHIPRPYLYHGKARRSSGAQIGQEGERLVVWVCGPGLQMQTVCGAETDGVDRGFYLACICCAVRPPNKAVLCPWLCLLHPGQT